MVIDQSHIDLAALVPTAATFKRAGSELHGSCPFCGGKDRFVVQPKATPQHWWCRQCNKQGDPVALVMALNNVPFVEAVAMLGLRADAPTPRRPLATRPTPAPDVYISDSKEGSAWESAEWQAGASALVGSAHELLLDGWGTNKASIYLQGRGISKEAAVYHRLGMTQERRETWGTTPIWIPRGIVIGWEIEWGVYLNVRVRRPQADIADGGDKYMSAKGCANGLYVARGIEAGCPVIVTEGEFDSMIVEGVTRQLNQHIGVVSIGSTTGARSMRWVMTLALASQIVLAFDADEAGDKAAQWWTMALNKQRVSRLRPDGAKDASDMFTNGRDMIGWINGAIHREVR